MGSWIMRLARFLMGLSFVTMIHALVGSCVAADAWGLVFHNKGGKLRDTPILAQIQENVPTGIYTLTPDSGSGKELIAEVFTDRGGRYVAASVHDVPLGSSVRYRLEPSSLKLPQDAGVAFNPNGSDLEISYGAMPSGRIPVMTHRSASGPKPYMYPLFGPDGVKITRAFPMADVAGEDRDHFHQRSLWFTHGNVNGFDFWASDPLNKPSPKFGSIKETSRDVVTSGLLLGMYRTTDDWLDPSGKPICTDERIVRIYPRPHVGLDGVTGAKVSLPLLLIDYDVTIKASHGPVTFGDTKEGMFGLRVASSMDVDKKKGGKITNAEGLTDGAAWGKASPWVDYVGPVDGKTVGVAILNHPSSFRYPTTWHVRTYGLFAANPFGWHDFGMNKSGEYTLPANESITFRYRLVLHEGDTANAHLEEAFRAYAQPPTVEIQKIE
jgi:hypothetical protein